MLHTLFTNQRYYVRNNQKDIAKKICHVWTVHENTNRKGTQEDIRVQGLQIINVITFSSQQKSNIQFLDKNCI